MTKKTKNKPKETMETKPAAGADIKKKKTKPASANIRKKSPRAG